MAVAASPPGSSGPVKEEAVEEPDDRPLNNGEAEGGRTIEVVEPTSPDTAMAEVKLERPESPEIRITDSPNPPPPTSTSNASSPSNPPTTPASSSAYAKSPIGSPAAAAAAASAGSPQPSLPSPPLLFQPFLPNKNAAAVAKSETCGEGILDDFQRKI